MAKKEIRLPFNEISDPQTITDRNIKAFKDNGLDIHKNEVDEIVDDHSRQQRVLKVRKVKYFDMGRGRGR